MRYLMLTTYDGRKFSGFQKQKNGRTIQEELEKAIEIVTKQKTSCVASGRTDAGVSAFLQPVHFDVEKPIDTQSFIRSMNGILPNEIKILNVFETNLHARFSAKKKTYVYKMYQSNVSLPLFDDALQISPNLDLKKMKKFCSLLKGTHDFKGFQSSGSPTETTIRTIYSAKLYHSGNYLIFSVTGNGFLYKMVRNIVGTMLKVGEGKFDLKELKSNLFNTFKATSTAKPEFLYLLNVSYNS